MKGKITTSPFHRKKKEAQLERENARLRKIEGGVPLACRRDPSGPASGRQTWPNRMGLPRKSQDWREALDQAVNRQSPEDIQEGKEVSLMCDTVPSPHPIDIFLKEIDFLTNFIPIY